MYRTRTVHLVAGALGAGALALVPTTAFATGSSTAGTGPASDPVCSQTQFQAAQQKVETGLSDRVTQLDKLLNRVQSAKHLTASDQSTLESDISGTELPGVEALQPEVRAATTCTQLRGYAHDMVYDFRVYVVMTPQADETIAADTETYFDQRLSGLEPKVQAAITKAQSKGKDVSSAQAAFADLQSQVGAAGSDVNGLSATLLAQTPAGYPGDKPVFESARTAEKNARSALKAAKADLKQIRSDLKGGSTPASTHSSPGRATPSNSPAASATA